LYCTKVYPGFPIVHIPTVMRTFDTESYLGDRKQTLLVLSMLLSGSTHARDDFNAHDISAIQTKCEDMCMQLKLTPYEQKNCGIEDIQAAILIAVAAFNNGQTRLARFLLDDAVRMSQHLGLLKDPVGTATNLIECEIRKRVAWMVFTSDLFSAFATNTPYGFDGDPFSLPLPLEVDDEFITEDRIQPNATGRRSVLSCMVLNIKLYQFVYFLLRYPISSETLVHVLTTLQEWKTLLSATVQNVGDEAFGIGRSNLMLTCFMIETTVRCALANRMEPLPTNTECIKEISTTLKKMPIRHIRCHGCGAVTP
jgi:hypothetical protein